MIILSHRGYWEKTNQKNTISSLIRSFNYNFGVELDIRDYNSSLVISHDIPSKNSELLKDFLKKIVNNRYFIAINIKADGLQDDLQKLLIRYKIKKYFVFDMSIPDCIQFMNKGMNFFIRRSDYEKDLGLYKKASGVWLDQFKKNWIDEKEILYHYKNKKKICIVSPELHKKNHIKEWKKYKKLEKKFPKINIMLCTDFPFQANIYFNSK